MSALVAQHPVMMRFRKALDAAYGERLERVVLYGSRARGDARPDSDWDVAVFIQDPAELWDEAGRLAAIETDLLYDSGELINAFPFRAGAYDDRTGFMSELRRDGVGLRRPRRGEGDVQLLAGMGRRPAIRPTPPH